MKDMDDAIYILGIQIFRQKSKRLIDLSQSTYIEKVLEMLNMQDFKIGLLPMSHDIFLNESQCHRTCEQREKMSTVICSDYWIHYVCHVMYTIRYVLCT
jgi:hypothetical protein